MTGLVPCLCRVTLAIAFVAAAFVPIGASAGSDGVDYDCTDFENRQDAQTFYEEMGGPLYDPYNLDDDADGFACEDWERDYEQKVSTDTGDDGIDRDCADFASQAEAERYFLHDGGSPDNNVDHLDLNRNGIACEEGEPG
ncbi:MAG: excalibur calcium-binding domain-containing protein [Thermomicrobiales bacterium]